MPILSIIIPVYNVEEYLKECLESVVNQTIENIEILIINDGSTDNSKDIINEYNNKYNNIKVINKKNGGLSSARNVGIEYSKGEYITFLDSDDYIDANMYKEMINTAYEKNVDVVECGIEIVSEDGERISNEFINEETIIYNKIDNIKSFLKFERKGYVWNKIYKREIFKKNKIRFPLGMYYEDMIVTLSVFNICDNVAVMPQCFYKYRRRQKSISNSISEKNIEDYAQQMKKWIEVCDKLDKNIYEKHIESFKIYTFLNILNWYIKYYKFDRKLIYACHNSFIKNAEPHISLIQCIFNNEISKGIKLIYVLYKFKLYDILMRYGIL